MGPDTARVSIPSWKLELIKTRRNSKTSASFSHYDRSRRPERFQSSGSSIPEDSPASPSDLIKFFNSTTDVARRNLSSSRSFSAGRRGAEMLGTREQPQPAQPAQPGARREGMSGGPGGDCQHSQHSQPGLLSCERTDGSVTVSVSVSSSSNKSHLHHLGQITPPASSASSYSLADRQPREEDETEDSSLSDLTWPDSASSVESDQTDPADRYSSDQGEVEILFRGSMQMGEDTRLFVSNAGARQDADRQARLSSGVGARLYRGRQGNKKNSGLGLNGNGSGDSDGMMGSGGESDSSEEIHYGPGFVSRLKSRYMSVALRGSPRGGLGTLRRTASLEYFLDCDKNCEEEVLELKPSHTILAAHTKPVSSQPTSSQAKANTKRESMKRAQSVEVLSFQAEKTPVLPSTFFAVDSGLSPPPSESPPPLPPRERDSPSVHSVLSSAPALVNDQIIISDKQPPPIPSAHPKPAPATTKKAAAPLTTAVSKPKMRSTGSSLSKTGNQKQRSSSGVLFGVKDRELPAPDIVKETRKLFESNSSGGRRAGTKAGGLTKAKSTSSLYSKSPSRSNSVEKAVARPATKPSYSSSPQRRPSSSPARPKLPSKTSSSSAVARPALPAKPSHLSPLVHGKPSSVRSSIVERHLQKVTPTSTTTKTVKSNYDKKSTGALRAVPGPAQTGSSNGGLVKASLANVIPSDSPGLEQDAKTRDLEHKSIQLNLRPINSEKETEKGTDDKGTKRITSASIENIRNSGNVVNFVFNDKSSGVKTHLPAGASDSAKSSPPKQVGVIRPISRDSDAVKRPGLDLSNHSDLKLKKDELKENKSSPIHVKKNNKVSGSKQNNDEKKKETLIIEKDPVFVPVESWKENTQSKNYINKKIHSENIPAAPPPSHTDAPPVILNSVKSPPSVPPRNGSKLEHQETSATTSTPSTTSTTSSQSRKYFDSNIEPLVPPPPSPGQTSEELVRSDAKAVTDRDKSTDVIDKAPSYRDSWKSRSDQQNNSFVFNFVNSKKDVSHIENDGLDLTKRSKKGGVILLDSNGESCDGDQSDGEVAEPVEASNTFVFVGAEIKTGKSSLRSKQSKKKLNISFNDKTEVFEYPSFESVDMDQSADIKEKEDKRESQQSSKPQQTQSIFKTNSTVVGSSGGLGSYTPSKIQISEAPFQLGVSRTTSTPTTNSSSSSNPSSVQSSKAPSSTQETILLPVDDGVSWGSAASSDMLF